MSLISKQLLGDIPSYDLEALRDDISRRGILVPIIVDSDTNTIIDGHHRYKIAQELQIECPIHRVSLHDDDEADVSALALNIKRRKIATTMLMDIAIKFREAGWSQRKIADALGVSLGLVNSWLPKEKKKEQVDVAPENDPVFKNEQTPKSYISAPNLSALATQALEIAALPDTPNKRKADAAYELVINKGYTQARAAEILGVSQPAVCKAIKKVEKTEAVKESINKQVEAIERGEIVTPDGVFDVIAIDPPWNYGTEYDAGGRRVANPYPEMTQEQLKAMDIPAADNCVMFLWTTQRFIWDAKELLDIWGFTYRATLVWDKDIIGMGDVVRMQCEFCLIGIKGKPEFLAKDVRDIIREKRREHSRKPDAFYDLIPRLVKGDRRVELFSREKRAGWAQLGNDAEKF